MDFDLIIISGDSFAAGSGLIEQYMFERKTERDKIPPLSYGYFLSEKMGIPLLNISIGGASNEGIIRRSLSLLEKYEFYKPYDRLFNFDLSNYNKILFITQWTFFHRFTFYFENEHKQIIPNKEVMLELNEFGDKANSFKKFLESKIDLEFDDFLCFDKFYYDYFLYNEFMKSKENIFHYNLFLAERLPQNLLNKIETFKTNIISDRNISFENIKTIDFETNGNIKDGHYGLKSCDILSDRIFEYLKKENYGLQ